MKKKQLAVLIPIVLILAIGIKIMATRDMDDPKKIMMDEYVFNADDVKMVEMSRYERQVYGGESSFLKAKMFDDESEYWKFPLAQKKGRILGVRPKNENDIVPKADFSVKLGKTKDFYKLKKTGGILGFFKKSSRVICMSLFQRSNMGKINDPKKYLTPKDLGYEGEFPYHFPYTIKTKKFGTIPYKCFVSNENEKLNKIFERYMKLRRRR